MHFEAMVDHEAPFWPCWGYMQLKAYIITLIYHEKKFHISEVTNPTSHQLYVKNSKKCNLRPWELMKQCYSHPGTMRHSKLI